MGPPRGGDRSAACPVVVAGAGERDGTIRLYQDRSASTLPEMASPRVFITGLGPVSGLGLGIETTWEALVEGRSAVDRVSAFDADRLDCRIAAEVRDFRINQFVPKTYRKATKVMARDIALAVACADRAARDAALVTKGTASNGESLSYPGPRMGCHIGAGLIAAELDELTSALATARDASGNFDIGQWGREGMQNLYPLWLLKYLPNMLACHVTIIHETQGPSNTITCGETSATLSVGESMRVIQRGAADVCFCGGTECKINPMTFLRQLLAGRLTTTGNDDPPGAVRPFCTTAAGTVLGEGGGILILESEATWERRRAAHPAASAYAELIGFGASQSVHRPSRNMLADPEGEGIEHAIAAALADANTDADAIGLIVPSGMSVPEADAAEAAALRRVFGRRLPDVALAPIKAAVGSCGAGSGALDACAAAAALKHQRIPAVLNCRTSLGGLAADAAPSRGGDLEYALVVSSGVGGQNAALVLKRMEGDRG